MLPIPKYFKDLLLPVSDEFDKNDWVEAFEWITINLKWDKCGCLISNWISYETM